MRVGPGASWGHVAESLAPAGLATAGGIGFLARKFGLTIDHVTAAELVLADGRIVRADASQNPDLLWALRGAGGNFGIVTAFELDAYPVSDVVFAQMLLPYAAIVAPHDATQKAVYDPQNVFNQNFPLPA